LIVVSPTLSGAANAEKNAADSARFIYAAMAHRHRLPAAAKRHFLRP
jgi:hypothetical protein